jgi:hypothetical protein
VIAFAIAACGGRQSVEVPPPTTAVAPPTVDAGAPPPPVGPPIDLVVGEGAAGVGAGQPIRVAMDVRAVRARPDSSEIAAAVRALPIARTFRTMTDVDLYVDGEWIVFYGANMVSPEKSVVVVRHAREDADLHPRDPHAKVLGDIVIRPQAHVVAIVPESRKAALAAELARPLEDGLRRGELLRGHVDEPARVFAPFVDGIARLEVLVRTADDGGLDMGADGHCASREICERAADELRALVKRVNGTFVQMAVRGMLDPLERDGIRMHDAHIEARLHAAPYQVRALMNVASASLGAPPPP